MLINGRHIRIIQAHTGELIRDLILNPAIAYEPQGIRKPRPNPTRGSKCRLCLATSQRCAARESNSHPLNMRLALTPHGDVMRAPRMPPAFHHVSSAAG
jgi:hypothetical protein